MEKCSSSIPEESKETLSIEVQKRLLDSWFPVNPQLLAKIRSNLSAGKYEDDCNLLIAELKEDISLFAFCLKRLIELAGERHRPVSGNPVDLVRTSNFEDLRKILSCQEADISAHRMQDMTHAQACCIQSTIISTTTATVLCEKESLPGDIGFCTALLRQLGLTLIAWNYPHVYQRALFTGEKEEPLDQALSRYLGYSPSLLGITIARKWGLSSKIRHALGDAQVKSEAVDPQAEFQGAALERICILGEAFAQASVATPKPISTIDWETAKAEIERRVGQSGFELLQERIYQATRGYLNYAPQMFTVSDLPQKPLQPTTTEGLDLLSRNTFLNHCPDKLRTAIQEIYSRLDGRTISKEILMAICRKVIPLGGFPRGCIYLVDPESQLLVPRLAIGTASLKNFESINFYTNSNSIISRAFRSNSPMHENKTIDSERLLTQVAGILGDNQRNGVLYLEIAESMQEQQASNITARFKALRLLLCDSLNLY